MCLACRQRGARKSMVRLQQLDNEIVRYSGKGRSFYLCEECLNNEKKIKGLTKRFRLDLERFIKFLKELIENG